MILKLFNFFKYGLALVILICLKNNLLMLTTDSGVKSHQENIRLVPWLIYSSVFTRDFLNFSSENFLKRKTQIFLDDKNIKRDKTKVYSEWQMQITCNKILLHFISTDFFQNLNLSYNASDFILTSPLCGRKLYYCLLLFWFIELIQLTHGARESGSATTAGVWRVYSWWCPDSKLRTPSNMSNYKMCQGWELNTACIMAIALLSTGTIWKSVSYYVLTLP